MPRPGIIIGLGGTGQWVLTWLKRDLLLSNNGIMPQNVKLIAIDTATRLEPGSTRVTASGKKEDACVVAGVSLNENEYIYIGGDSRPIADLVREGKLKNISQWYQADTWLQTLTPASFILDDGASRFRQLGRVAVYKDLLGQKTYSKILRSLSNAIENIRSQTDQQHRLEIIIVGSLAGGTGSSILIDIALISRMLANQFAVQYALSGYIALPSVFSIRPDDEMKVRTFAAWRELNRFMVVNPEFPLSTIEYIENSSELRVQPTSRLFDVCYLIEGNQNGRRLTQAPAFGVFPIVSEAISSVLDKKAGIVQTQQISTNIAVEYARNPNLPMYGAVGAFTFKVPAFYSKEIAAYKFAQNLLLCLLSPKEEPDNEGRLEASGADRCQRLAAPDRNKEEDYISGRQNCLKILQQGVSFEERSIRPTPFHSRIAEYIVRMENLDDKYVMIDELARAGSDSSRKRNGWSGLFSNLVDYQEYQDASKKAFLYEEYYLPNLFERHVNETEEEVRARIRTIPGEIRSFFGGKTPTGSDDYGLYGTPLRDCANFQADLFRKLVQGCLSQILNGQSENVIMARSGKIGYAKDYFDGLIYGLDQFLDFLNDVKRRRDEIQSDFGIMRRLEMVEKSLAETSGKKFLLLIEHPDVRRAEKSYLLTQQQAINIRREDILFLFVIATVHEMKNICLQTRDILEEWICHLSIGDASNKMPGLWDGLRNGINELKDSYNFDLRANSAIRLIDTIEVQPNEQDLSRGLGRWKWVVNFVDKSHILDIKVLISSSLFEDNESDVIRLSSGTSNYSKLDIGRKNQSNLLKLARETFIVTTNTSVADEIQKQFLAPLSLAREISDRSRTLFDGTPESHPLSKSLLVQLQTNLGETYFKGKNGLESTLRDIHNLPSEYRNERFDIAVIDSDDPYKLSVVNTEYCYLFNHYISWSICLEAYTRYIFNVNQHLDPSLMHIFAAEARAVEFERRMMFEGKAYRPLHPRVVSILEDTVALQQFVYLFALGMIVEITDTKNRSHWQLTWQKGGKVEEIWLTNEWSNEDKSWRDCPDIFNAIQGYVITRKTYKAGRIDRIDIDFAKKIIGEKILAIGVEKEHLLLEQCLGSNNLLGILRKTATNKDYQNIDHQEYADLADVIEFIIKDRLGIYSQNAYLKEDSTTRDFSIITKLNPQRASVGQELSLLLEFRPTSSGKDTVSIPMNAEINCFITADGLQILGSQVSVIHFEPLTDRLLPIQFELQALLCGNRQIQIQIFTEDPASGNVQVFHAKTEITVSPPQTFIQYPEILPSLNINVASRPDFVLNVISDLAADDDFYRLIYVLTSRLPGAQYQNELVGTTAFKPGDLAVIQRLLSDVIDLTSAMSLDDLRERVNSLGSWLFNKVFPAQSAGLIRDIFQKVGGRVQTLLILEDGMVWLPWEIISFPATWNMPPATWGERYQISRWLRGLGTTLYRDLPLGEISLVHYKPLVPGQVEDQDIAAWARVLNAYKSYGIEPVIQPEMPVYALHILHEPGGSKLRDIILRNDDSEVRPKSVDDEMVSHRLDLHRKRPVVTISAPNLESEINTGNIGGWVLHEHSLPFLRAGASAILGSYWNVSASTDRIFWGAFYDYLGERVPLGDAVRISRNNLRYLRPDRLDHLAYVCFGDPLARSYLPEPGEGYAALECINSEDPLRPGKTYYFRASLQKRPPIDYTDKLIKAGEFPEQLHALFLAPGLQKTIPKPVPMQPYGRHMVEATFEVTPSISGDYPLIVQILKGDEHLKTLQINLKVRDLHIERG